jgi:nucleoside-diphosphate-sugar epimerase
VRSVGTSGSGLPKHGTLLSIEKARRVLGYEPTFSWRAIL